MRAIRTQRMSAVPTRLADRAGPVGEVVAIRTGVGSYGRPARRARYRPNTLSAARTRNMKLLEPPPITYSACCQR
jgi:hypothetical protein